MIPLLFVYVSMCFGVENAVKGSPYISRIPDILQELCPSAKVCQENLTHPASEETFWPGFQSCCTDCSCSPECEENGNCCFPHSLSSYDTDDLRPRRGEATSACLFPMARQPKEKERIYYQSYYMISSAQESDGNYLSNQSCGDEKVAPWGSLYPVYSAQNKRIYKNMACASANGVTDGKFWDAVLVCDKNVHLDTSFMIWVDSTSVPGKCAVTFIYRGNSKDIQPLQCYSDLINTCPGTGFEMPDAISVSKNDVIQFCTSGLVSPFRALNMYANVFCHLCNTGYLPVMEPCQVDEFVTPRGSNDLTFLGLIDGIFIREILKKRHQRRPKPEMTCTTAGDDMCRVLFCPSGQLRSEDGNCRYLTKVWYNQEYTIYIRLKSDIAFSVYDVFQVPVGGQTMKLPPFKSPWPNKWFIDKIYFEMGEGGGQSSTALLVILKNKLSVVEPTLFMQHIKELTTKDWTLQTNDVKLVLKSSFMPFTTEDYVLSTPIIYGEFSAPEYQPIYRRILVLQNEFLVTNLYMCNQVELNQSEFTLSQDKMILFNNITKRFMLNGEFTLISSRSFDGVRARICTEDLQQHVSGAVTFFDLFSVLKFAAALLFCVKIDSVN